MSFLQPIFLYISHALSYLDPTGCHFEKQNMSEDMPAILQKFHIYLPILGDEKFDAQLVGGDQ